MKKSAYFSDLIFAFTVVFLPVLCYLRFRGVTLWLSALLSALLGICVCGFVGLWMKKKYRGKQLKAQEKRQAEMLSLHLALLSQREQAEFFAERTEPFLQSETVHISRYGGRHFVATDEGLLFPLFLASPLTANHVLPLLAQPTEGECILLCSSLDSDCERFLSRFTVRVFTAEEIYLRLKEKNALPVEYKSEKAFTKKKKRGFALWLQKKNARPFLTSGALLLISSLFSPFPYYYLLTGIFLVVTSMLIRIFGKE